MLLLHSNTFDNIQLLAHQLANVNQQMYLVKKKTHECPMGNFSQTLPSFLTLSPAGDYYRQGTFTYCVTSTCRVPRQLLNIQG